MILLLYLILYREIPHITLIGWLLCQNSPKIGLNEAYSGYFRGYGKLDFCKKSADHVKICKNPNGTKAIFRPKRE